MTVLGNDHLVILVKDIDEAIQNWTNLGLTLTHRVSIDAISMDQAFFLLPKGGFIELIAPSSADSPLQKTLEKRGEGIHTLALEVSDITTAVSRMQSQGVEVVGEGTDQVFVHPKSTNGVRIQLWDTNRPHRWQANPSEKPDSVESNK
jgi:methylmalonyl-CoA epimerase